MELINKKAFGAIILVVILSATTIVSYALIVSAGAVESNTESEKSVVYVELDEADNDRIIGGERDEYGCLGPAGYSWCETTLKCQRFWEEPCE